MGSDSTRDQGIEFGSLDEALRSVDYPASAATVRREHGDHELELAGGSTTLGVALAELEGETFESAEAVLQAVKNAVGSDAVGREGYTDRGGLVDPESRDEESF